MPLPARRPATVLDEVTIRIGAVIDIEQHALRALEQDLAAAAQRRVEIAPHGLGERQHEIGDCGQVAAQPFAVDRRFLEAGAQRIMMRAQAVEQRVELVEMGEVADADRPAPNLVLISRADAAPGGVLRPRSISRSVDRGIGRLKGQVRDIARGAECEPGRRPYRPRP